LDHLSMFAAQDPIVVMLAWVLTALIAHFFTLTDRPKLRAALPSLALLFAVGARAGFAVVQGEPITWTIVGSGFLAGATAVFGHSQFRELIKKTKKDGSDAELSKFIDKIGPVAVIVLVVIGLSIPGCVHRVVLRDADVYKLQLEWLAARNAESIVAHEVAVAAAKEVDDRESCLLHAEQLLVERYAVSYRYAQMAYLADLAADPGPMRRIPEASSLCGGAL